MWRNGLPQMMDPSWPPEQSIFLKVEKGQLIWLGKNRPEPSNCIRCHNAVCGTRSFACMACVPALLGRNLNTNPSSSLNWPLLLDALPLLAPAHVESLLKRRNIKMAVRSVARFLSISLPANILEMLLIPRKWYGAHLQSSNSTPDHTQISSSEISSSLQKLAFLTLIKSSNSTHPPNGKTFSSETVGGILFANTRYSSEGLEKVFKIQQYLLLLI